MRRVLPASVVLSLLVALAAGAAPRPVSADGTRDVQAWIELSSTSPTVGCTLAVNVEIRESGAAVSRTEVALALFVGSAVVAADTSGTRGGADAWGDGNVASAYPAGLSIFPSSGGGCDTDGKMIEVTGTVPAVQVEATASGAPLGRPPRQRDPGRLLRRPERPVRLPLPGRSLPGWLGKTEQTGTGLGEGFTVNVPLPPEPGAAAAAKPSPASSCWSHGSFRPIWLSFPRAGTPASSIRSGGWR